MKNILPLAIAILLISLNTASAQFADKPSFIGGGFFSTFNKYKADQNTESNSYNHNLNVSWGKFAKENKATGWSITQSLIINKVRARSFDPKPLRSLGLGMERFWEFYKPIINNLSVYVRPVVGVNYSLENSYQTENEEILVEGRTNRIMLSAGVGAGLTWRVTPKWALYGGFAVANPFNISAALGTSEYLTQQNANGENLKQKGVSVNYSFSPTLSSGSIGLGFRYFYGMK